MCKKIQKDYFALFRGVNKELISLNLEKHLPPWNSDTDRGYPSTVVEANYVYGVTCRQKHTSFFYKKDPNCLVYFTSRFLCLLDYTSKQQKIITLGRMKISCIACSKEGVIAVGEVAANPQIYILNGKTLQTTLKQEVLHMSFYSSKTLYSFGFQDNIYSLNIHDVVKGSLVGERLVQEKIERILALSETSFVSIGAIKVWEDLYSSATLGYATALDMIESSGEVCLGNEEGNLYILKEKELVLMKSKAHLKQISIVRAATWANMPHVSLLTGSLDETVKIWDSNFEELHSIELKSCVSITPLSNTNHPLSHSASLTISSIDSKEQIIMVSLQNGQTLLCEVTSEIIISTPVILEHSSPHSHPL